MYRLYLLEDNYFEKIQIIPSILGTDHDALPHVCEDFENAELIKST